MKIFKLIFSLTLLASLVMLLAGSRLRQRTLAAEPLFLAIEHMDVAEVERLLASGIPVNARRFSNPPEVWEYFDRVGTWCTYRNYPFSLGYTPLMIASMGGDEKLVRVLLAHGADIHAVYDNRDHETAAMMARRYEHRQIANLLEGIH